MKILLYEEEDRFAKEVVTALYSLSTMRRSSSFGDFSYLAHERVWSGEVAVTDKLGQTVAHPMALVAVSVGPDYEAILKACGVTWSDVVRLQTWKPVYGSVRPKRLMSFVLGSPVTILLRDAATYRNISDIERWRKKRENDARRVALQIIDTMLVHSERLKKPEQVKVKRVAVSKRRPRRERLSLPYFAEQ